MSRAWLEENQRHLSTSIAVVGRMLEVHAARSSDAGIDNAERELAAAREQCQAATQSLSSASAVDQLCATFELSAFERHILLMCAGVELDAGMALSCARAQGDAQRLYATFGLALAALPQSHWSALLPEGPLRYWHLIEVVPAGGSPSAPVTTRPIRIDERVLHYLAGLQHVDDRLASLVTPMTASHGLAATHVEIAERLVRVWTRDGDGARVPAINLFGADPASARAIAETASRAVGLRPFSLAAQAIPGSPAEAHLFIRLWERETRLASTALVVDCEDAADPVRDVWMNTFIARLNGPVVAISRDRRPLKDRAVAGFEIARPTTSEQRVAWSAALAESRRAANGEVDRLTAQFCLNVPEIYSAAHEAQATAASPTWFDAVWNACRIQSRSRLEELAQRIDSTVTFDDLVLPVQETEILEEILAEVKHRSRVHDEWGFAGKSARGLGISALFAGASGTGKTMAAEVLAHALQLDLYRIDLSAVVSKYIGETEKNLRRIFDAAEGGGAILLFDEADALFGKRSDVKDSHDRYANIEVSYLLQRMESYRGLAILTTNMKSALDAAFLRRIRFIVQFPFPDAKERAEIWRRVFPHDTPTQELNVERLAQLSVAGGSIRNVAIKAAFLAADADEPVAMAHLLRAARSEYAKLEKPLTDAEVAGWS